MIRLAVILISIAGAAKAETIQCALDQACTGSEPCRITPVVITFAIDRNQFAPPVDAAEPPRVKRTFVKMDGEGFVAEPFVLQQMRGFWTEAEARGTRMLTAMADGSARYSDTGTGLSMTGHCQEVS